MGLDCYFSNLIELVEKSDIDNGGVTKSGFYKPTRVLLVRHLNLLKDLHGKPRAKQMVQSSWKFVVEELPPEWLVLDEVQKKEIEKMLAP